MALHIVEESERCLGCKRPGCQGGCPVGTPVPQIVSLFKDRRIEEAGRVLFENNPLSLACSLVCNHGAQCQGGCVLGRKGSPVQFWSIESYVSDSYLGRLRPEPPLPNGKKAALIGSGPAGITAAFELARARSAATCTCAHRGRRQARGRGHAAAHGGPRGPISPEGIAKIAYCVRPERPFAAHDRRFWPAGHPLGERGAAEACRVTASSKSPGKPANPDRRFRFQSRPTRMR